MRCFFILLAAIMLSAVSAYAQWSPVAPNLLAPVYLGGSADYGGAIWCGDGMVWVGKDNLWSSSDSGRTWSKAAFPEAVQIVEIAFFNKNIGAIATQNDFVYTTVDGGLTWTRLPNPTLYDRVQGVFFLGSADRLALCTANSGILVTSITGQSYNQAQFGAKYVMDGRYLGNGTAVAMILDEGNTKPGIHSSLIVTSDYGQQWHEAAGMADWDCNAIEVDQCDRSTIYLINEAGIPYAEDDGNSDIFVSHDLGDHWERVLTRRSDASTISPYLSGSITASPNAVFAQTRTDGVIRSSDKGAHWISIGGPNIGYDTRFIGAMNDQILFAVDSFGTIWKTENSGGDSLQSLKFSSAKIINDTSGAVLALPIYLYRLSNQQQISMVMTYPASLLSYQGSYLTGGLPIDVASHPVPGRSKLLIRSGMLDSMGTSAIGYSLFRWIGSSTECAHVQYDSIRSSEPITVSCGAPSDYNGQSFEGIVATISTCIDLPGTSAEVNPMHSSDLFRVVPNPVRDHATIYSDYFEGQITITLFDELGKPLISEEGSISTSAAFSLDLSALPSGSYHLRLHPVSLPVIDLGIIHESK